MKIVSKIETITTSLSTLEQGDFYLLSPDDDNLHQVVYFEPDPSWDMQDNMCHQTLSVNTRTGQVDYMGNESNQQVYKVEVEASVSLVK